MNIRQIAPFYLNHFIQFDGEKTLNRLTPVDLDYSRKFKLALRRLSSLTLEEALELCKIVDDYVFGHFRFTKWKVQTGPKQSKDWQTLEVRNEKVQEWFEIDLIDGVVYVYHDANEKAASIPVNCYWHWYILKGFDIPFLPDNQTLMQVGLAIDLAEFPEQFNQLVNEKIKIG
jgi:hypothetical protein